MFKKLRKHLVIFNLIVTTIILVTAFLTVYLVVKGNIEARSLAIQGTYNDSSTQEYLKAKIRDERKASLESLLVTLVVTGVIVEFCVAVFSNIWASDAIKPVKQAYEAQKIFIANASHEIKTPLAAIQANLEAADIHDNKFIKNIEHEVKGLANLNRELLSLAKTDIIEVKDKKPEAIRPLIEEVLADFLPRTKKIKLEVDLENEEEEISAEDFSRLTTILIDNALKYCQKNVGVTFKNGLLTVENDGTIIPAEKLPHIFERFYQADKSSEGVGLGLSIAALLAERNNWKLNVESSEATGRTSFSLKI